MKIATPATPYLFALILLVTATVLALNLNLAYTPLKALLEFYFVPITSGGLWLVFVLALPTNLIFTLIIPLIAATLLLLFASIIPGLALRAVLILPLCSLLTLAYYLIYSHYRSNPLSARLQPVVPAATVMTAMTMATPSFLSLTTYYTPVIDLYAAAFQARLGLLGAEFTLTALVKNAGLNVLFFWAYCAITVSGMIMVVCSNAPKAYSFLASWIGVCAIGFPIYALLPMIGPEIALIYYPDIATTLPVIDVFYPSGALEPRNAVPSLHTAWALLLIYYSRGLSRPVQSAFTVFGIMNIMATVVLTQHWLLDLIIAVPLTTLTMYFTWPVKPSHSNQYGTLVCLATLIALSIGLGFYPAAFVEYAFIHAAILTMGCITGAALSWRWAGQGFRD